MSERWKNHWDICERIVIEGQLVLDSPAHFGNGDVSALMDMPVMRDPVDGTFVLTGASIAGALRAYLTAQNEALAGQLFGRIKGDKNKADPQAAQTSYESALVVYDARTDQKSSEVRDHVRLNPATRTVDGDGKFDMEVIEAGTTFKLRFDLHRAKNEEALLRALAFALAGLQTRSADAPGSDIGLGKRKSRGFGQCHVSGWRVRRYQMNAFEDLMAWIRDDRAGAKPCADIRDELGQPEQKAEPVFIIRATFALDGSLIIRSDGSAGQSANNPDHTHLASKREGAPRPIISGTTLAGALRARASRIVNTLNAGKSQSFVDEMFGSAKPKAEMGVKKDSGHISSLRVGESVIKNPLEMVHTRVKIDRFTGGAYPSGLFSEQSVFARSDDATEAAFNLELRKPTAAQKGMLLLLLKDLWTGDLPLGGESSVGRGRLKGKRAVILNEDGQQQKIEAGKDGVLLISAEDAAFLENFVTAFKKEMGR